MWTAVGASELESEDDVKTLAKCILAYSNNCGNIIEKRTGNRKLHDDVIILFSMFLYDFGSNSKK